MNHTLAHSPDLIARPRLAVVIVNYNSWPDVARLVGTLSETAEVKAGQCEVIVVDNASQGPIPQVLEGLPAGVRLILRPSNGGFAAGVNAGWRACRSQWILLLNPDVVVEPETIRHILDRLAVHEGCANIAPAIVGFALKNPDGSAQPSVGAEPSVTRSVLGQFIPRSRRNYQADWRIKSGQVRWVTGACMLVEVAMLNDLRGMDEDFFLYYEEVDLCRRAWNHGRSVVFDDSVAVTHLSPLQNREITPKMRVITRHAKLLFFRKHKSTIEFRLLCAVVFLEAWLWEIVESCRNRPVPARSWRAIRWLATNAIRGRTPKGREVLLLAEHAASVRTVPPRPLGSRKSKAIESSRKRS